MLMPLAVLAAILGTLTAPGLIAQAVERRKAGSSAADPSGVSTGKA